MTQEKISILKERKLKRFTVQLLNTGLIIIREEPFFVKKRKWSPELKKTIEIEVPVWRYIKNPSHTLVINPAQPPLALKLPSYVLKVVFEEFLKK